MPEDHTGQCVTCAWWDAQDQSDEITAQGECRRHVPLLVRRSVLVSDGLREDEWGWPWTYGADWCGEWTRRS
jgi:hypothetical protein